ncbi:hypothetical protein BJX63DRAFT_438765 [Aspergillus granulosus]|uniref:Uncharacterized protein n=1 Tax=Aspergillus granulosus TaxID=176169 RepID=A0ABR4GR46_9EURO
MPPKRAPELDQAQPRVHPYDLRRKNIPSAEPPLTPGGKQARTSIPRKPPAAVAAIGVSAKKQAIPKAPRRNVVVKKVPVSTRQPPAKRVRFNQEPPMASGALQPPAEPSSETNTTGGEEDDEAEDEANEEEEEDLPVPAPAQGRGVSIQNVENIASSDFEAMEAHADAAAASLYVAREAYKAAQHKIQVAQARRRYMELRHDGPMTSDTAEALEEDISSTDFPLEVSLQLYANKKVVVRKVLGEITRKTFNIEDFKLMIDQHFQTACGLFEYNLSKCTATFKHSSGRGGTRAHDLDHLSEAEAEDLLDLVEAARNCYSTGHMIISFAVYVEYDPKAVTRAATEVDLSSPVPSSPPPASVPAKKGRKNRSSYLQEQHEARVQAIRNIGDFQRQLMERWRCIDENCTNQNNFCFLDPLDRSKHYNITAPQIESWASAISSSEATIHGPPIKIWQYWQNQGAITRESREPARKSAATARQATIDRLIEMQTQNMEMMMQQRIMDQMESYTEKEERREELKERRQIQRNLRQQELERGPPLQYSGSLPSVLYTPRPQPPTQQAPTPAPVPIFLNRTSSPIDAAEEDADILAAFFVWKLQITRNSDRKAKWERARDIIMENDWSIRDLQLMEDDSSSMYNRAIKAGISDGFARGFREELRVFKLVYRQQRGVQEEEAIQALNSLGGGF